MCTILTVLPPIILFLKMTGRTHGRSGPGSIGNLSSLIPSGRRQNARRHNREETRLRALRRGGSSPCFPYISSF